MSLHVQLCNSQRASHIIDASSFCGIMMSEILAFVISKGPREAQPMRGFTKNSLFKPKRGFVSLPGHFGYACITVSARWHVSVPPDGVLEHLASAVRGGRGLTLLHTCNSRSIPSFKF